MQWTRESPYYRRACHIRRNFDKAYDRLKRDWAEKFLSVDREDSDSAPLDLLVKNSTNAEIGDWRLQEGDRQAKKLRRGKVLIKSAFMNWSLAFSCPSDSLIVFTVRSSWLFIYPPFLWLDVVIALLNFLGQWNQIISSNPPKKTSKAIAIPHVLKQRRFF